MGKYWEIWFKPKETIRKIVDHGPNSHLLFLSSVTGFILLCNLFQLFSITLRLSFPLAVLMLLLISPIMGYLYLSGVSIILTAVGTFMRGKGKFKEIRCALAWSSIPLIIPGLSWVFLLIYFGKDLFSHFPGAYPLSHGKIFLVLGVTLIQWAFSLWSMILYIFGLSEVQGYSIIRALVNTLIACMSVILIFLILSIFIFYLWGRA